MKKMKDIFLSKKGKLSMIECILIAIILLVAIFLSFMVVDMVLSYRFPIQSY